MVYPQRFGILECYKVVRLTMLTVELRLGKIMVYLEQFNCFRS